MAKHFTNFSLLSSTFVLFDRVRVSICRWNKGDYYPFYDWKPTFKCLPIGLNVPLLPKIGVNLYIMAEPDYAAQRAAAASLMQTFWGPDSTQSLYDLKF